MRTTWRCEYCDARGAVRHRHDAGVWEVVERIAEQHQRNSPHCRHGTECVRVPSVHDERRPAPPPEGA